MTTTRRFRSARERLAALSGEKAAAPPKGSWGGRRPGAGRRKASAPAEAKKRPAYYDPAAVLRLVEASKRAAVARDARNSPFQVAQHPPAAMPPQNLRMAMDDSLAWASTQWAGAFAGYGSEGVTFLGFQFLAELTQRPEYRVISETIATEMTRKWIKFRATGEKDQKKNRPGEQVEGGEEKNPGDKTEKIKELVDFMENLRVRDRFADVAVNDGFFGRSHLFPVFDGLDVDSQAGRDELKTPIGNGRDQATLGKVARGSLTGLRVIEPVWTYPTTYNARNPLAGDWYNPQVWYVMGTEIHRTRLPTFIGRPVPDLLKPAYSFGGLSLSQMAMPYVDIWLKTRASVGELIHAFSVMVLMTDLNTLTSPSAGSGADLLARAALFNALRDNMGLMMINKESEDFKNVSASLSGLEGLQAQSQEHMASVARIPLVKFTGISPTGLNASSEGEMRAFYDTINAYQNKLFRPNLTTIVDFCMISLWGERDPEITWDFEPLWEITEKEKGELRKNEAEVDEKYIGNGVLGPEDVRKRIAEDPESIYHGIDPDDVPDLQEEEEEGLEPEGGRPDPKAGGEPGKGGAAAGDAVLPFRRRR